MKANRSVKADTVAGQQFSGPVGLVACFARMAGAEWRKLVADVSRALTSKRRHREAIERELFGGQYMLLSKNDDDLPIQQNRRQEQPPGR